jgi:hypothetical protein
MIRPATNLEWWLDGGQPGKILPMTTVAPSRTIFDEAKHPRDPAGKFAPKGLAGRQRLLAAYDAGHEKLGDLGGGNRALSVEKVKLSDGTVAVVKTVGGNDLNPAEARKEVLAGAIANTLGITNVHTVEIEENRLLTEFVAGTDGNAIIAKATAGIPGFGRETDKKRVVARKAEEDRVAQLDQGREIGILDWLVDNPDRHQANWLVSADGTRVTPIDQGNSRFVPTRYPSGAKGEEGVIRELGPDSPFAAYWTGLRTTKYGEIKSLKPRVSQQYLADLRDALERVDFGPDETWRTGVFDRLAMLEAKAPKRISGERPFGQT